MKICSEDPTKLVVDDVLDDLTLDTLRTGLTYTDKSAYYLYLRFKKTGSWFADRNGQDAYDDRLKELQTASKVCLLNTDPDGSYWVRSGLSGWVSAKLGIPVQNNIVYPKPQLLPWDKKPEHEIYPYQKQALEKLLEARHAGVQIGTGLGKSLILLHIIKNLGLRTVVMAPSSSIADQLHSQLQKAFGKQRVGAFYGGKKEVKKLITVGTAQSLTRVQPGTPLWKALGQTEVFIADESHQCPASTLASVCFGAVAGAPYRFFFSATQMRNDGSDLLLEAITGPIVYEMTVAQGVDQGYLARPRFRMFTVPPTDGYVSDDANKMTRHHLFYNPAIAKFTGQLVNSAVQAGMPVLVLIEEVEQFTKLLPYLSVRPGFAHGPLNEDNREKVPRDYWDSDPNDLVAEFNAGLLSVLVGTSCISTGTDVKPVKFLVYWQGGKSEIQVKQAIGRGTRLSPGKKDFHVVDFEVDAPIVGRHAEARRKIYEELCGPVEGAAIR